MNLRCLAWPVHPPPPLQSPPATQLVHPSREDTVTPIIHPQVFYESPKGNSSDRTRYLRLGSYRSHLRRYRNLPLLRRYRNLLRNLLELALRAPLANGDLRIKTSLIDSEQIFQYSIRSRKAVRSERVSTDRTACGK